MQLIVAVWPIQRTFQISAPLAARKKRGNFMAGQVIQEPAFGDAKTPSMALSNCGVRGGVPPPGPPLVGTAGQPAARTAALREAFTLPNVAEITGKFGGADKLRNAVNKLQYLLYAA